MMAKTPRPSPIGARIWPRLLAVAFLALPAATLAGTGPKVVFACQDGTRLSVAFSERMAVLGDGIDGDVALEQQLSGSGFRYAGAGHDLRGKGDEVTWTAPGRAPRICKSVGAEGAGQRGRALLGGTRWQLVKFKSPDSAIATMRPADPARYTLEFLEDGRIAMRMDCSRAVGRWRTHALGRAMGRLAFEPAGSPRDTCPAGSLEARLVADALSMRAYYLDGDELHTTPAGRGAAYVWQRVP